jgi:hypothetical protein
MKIINADERAAETRGVKALIVGPTAIPHGGFCSRFPGLADRSFWPEGG